ncbi:MAG: DUF167 domain-containing protein [Nannocystaceae bacterium]
MSPAPLRPFPGGVEVDVQVIPRASRSRVVGLHGDRLKIQLAAPPVDGAANEALCELVADLVGLPRSAVVVARGATSKRKTLRLLGADLTAARAALGLAADADAGDLASGSIRSDLAGTDDPASPSASTRPRAGDPRRRRRAPLAAAPLALGLALAGCENSGSMAITVILPEDHSDLERADNAAYRVEPDGVDRNVTVDGTDFSIDIEFVVDNTQRTLSLYLARGEELLAWGRSAPFVVANTEDRLALFLGRPGRLSTYPGAIEEPDPDVLAAHAFGRGAVLLTSDGGTYLFSERTFTIGAGVDFDPDDPPEASDGALVSEYRGGVVRVAWEHGLRAWRFDPGVDQWDAMALGGSAAAIGDRGGAAHLVDADARALILFGGGEASDIVELRLVPSEEDDTYHVNLLAPALDGPRQGASAAWVTREGTDEGEGVLLFGGDDPGLPLVFFTATSQTATLPAPDDAIPWTGAACAQVEAGDDAGNDVILRILCVGGLRGDTATADAALIRVAPAQDLTVELLPALLPTPSAILASSATPRPSTPRAGMKARICGYASIATTSSQNPSRARRSAPAAGIPFPWAPVLPCSSAAWTPRIGRSIAGRSSPPRSRSPEPALAHRARARAPARPSPSTPHPRRRNWPKP